MTTLSKNDFLYLKNKNKNMNFSTYIYIVLMDRVFTNSPREQGFNPMLIHSEDTKKGT